MQHKSFKRYLDDIERVPTEKLKEYISALEKKVNHFNDKSSKVTKQILILVIGYFLISNSIVDSLKIGPFNIEDIKVIITFIPFTIAVMINNAASNFYSAHYHNFLLSLLLRKYYKLNERTLLLSKILPIATEHAALRVEKKEFSLSSCLFKIPIVLALLTLGIMIIPFYYFVVIKIIIEEYNSGHDLSFWTFWLPNSFAILFLLTGLSHGWNLLMFIGYKSLLYDDEDEKNKKKRRK